MTKKLVPVDTDDLEKLLQAHSEIIESMKKMKVEVNRANCVSYNLAFYNRVAKDFIRDLGLWDQWNEYYNERKDEENRKRMNMN